MTELTPSQTWPIPLVQHKYVVNISDLSFSLVIELTKSSRPKIFLRSTFDPPLRPLLDQSQLPILILRQRAWINHREACFSMTVLRKGAIMTVTMNVNHEGLLFVFDQLRQSSRAKSMEAIDTALHLDCFVSVGSSKVLGAIMRH